MSAIQSLVSALRLKFGCISSIKPPKVHAPINNGSIPRRLVRANGKVSAAKVARCNSLSLDFCDKCTISRGQSIASVITTANTAVIYMSRLVSISAGIYRVHANKAIQHIIVVFWRLFGKLSMYVRIFDFRIN